LLPYSINSVDYEDGPYVTPDESFLIFESHRPEGIGGSGDLYISFKNNSGGWNIPVNMGEKVNSAATERFARLSPDGKYLFFGSTRNASANNVGFDIFWIDANVIDDLKKEASAQTAIDVALGQEILSTLLNNQVDSASRKLSKWLTQHPTSLDATVVYSSLLRKQKNFSQAEALLMASSQSWSENTSIIMEKALVKFGMNKNEEAIKLLAPILVDADQLRERYIYLSFALLEMQKFETSDDYFEKAMAIHASPFPYYRRGCAYAKIDQKDRAFASLSKAVDLGINARREYQNNPDLAGLKNDSRWQTLIEKIK
jgi:tetratricopeptide (TPR) repeat protein